MAKRARPLTAGTRIDERELAEVDAAARLKGLNRSEYLRAAVVTQAKRDLHAWVNAPALAERTA